MGVTYNQSSQPESMMHDITVALSEWNATYSKTYERLMHHQATIQNQHERSSSQHGSKSNLLSSATSDSSYSRQAWEPSLLGVHNNHHVATQAQYNNYESQFNNRTITRLMKKSYLVSLISKVTKSRLCPMKQSTWTPMGHRGGPIWPQLKCLNCQGPHMVTKCPTNHKYYNHMAQWPSYNQ